MSVLDTIATPKITTGNVSGPASYAAGGFLLDLSASFSILHHLELVVETAGSLMPAEYEVTLNRNLAGAFAPGNAVIKLTRVRYDKRTVGTVFGAPSGVTVHGGKTATGTTTGSSHTHDFNHDHPSTVSGTPTAGGDGVNATAGGVAIAGHTHSVDFPLVLASTGTVGSHTHNRSFEYEHAHGMTKTETTAIATEVAAATNLSATIWRYCAVGF